MDIYRALYRRWGDQYWWPGLTRFEVIVGAILTQNTAWTNVEQAIKRLRREKVLTLRKLHETDTQTLAGWIKPAGYFNIKARRLHAFTSMVYDRFGGRLDRLWKLEDKTLRRELLSVKGIGPETADSILLYAAGRPYFVVDAYTRRFMKRHGWISGSEKYDEIAMIFTESIPGDPKIYNEYHALIVRLGKTNCRTRPDCGTCPLQKWLSPTGPVSGI